MSGHNSEDKLDAAMGHASRPSLPPGLVARIVSEVPKLPQEAVEERPDIHLHPAPKRAGGVRRFKLAAAIAGVAVLTGVTLALAGQAGPAGIDAPEVASPEARTVASSPREIVTVADDLPVAVLPEEATELEMVPDSAQPNKPVLAETGVRKRPPAPTDDMPTRSGGTINPSDALASNKGAVSDQADGPTGGQELVDGPIEEASRSAPMIGPVLPPNGLGYAGSVSSDPQTEGAPEPMGGGPSRGGPPSRGPGR